MSGEAKLSVKLANLLEIWSFYRWIVGTRSQNFMLGCQILLTEFQLKRKAFKDRGFILDTKPFSRVNSHFFLSSSLSHNKADSQEYQQHSSTQSCDSLARTTACRAHNTVWAWRSWDSHLVNESTSTSAVNLRGSFGPALLPFSLSHPPNFSTCWTYHPAPPPTHCCCFTPACLAAQWPTVESRPQRQCSCPAILASRA